MSVVAGDEVLVKGAPDAVLDLCDPAPGAAAALGELADRGLRVLAIASRRITDGSVPSSAAGRRTALDAARTRGARGPSPRGARDALAACRKAGIRVAMITGDHPATARAIAAEVGLLSPDGLVVEGTTCPMTTPSSAS